MATITVGDLTPRNQYVSSSGQTSFAYTFPIFADGDLKVYIGSTLQTLTTHYTVSGAATSNGGNVTLVSGATAGDVVTIYRDIPVSRTSDYQASGDLLAETLNDDFDKTVMMAQQNESSLSLGLRVDQWDDYGNLTLPGKASRVGKVLAFNATTGDPEGGPTIADTNTVAGISADISTVAGIDTDVTTLATNISYVQVVSGIDSEITSLHGLYNEIYRLGPASVVTDLGVLGQASVVADMQLLADLEDGTVATNTLQTIAGDSADIQTLAATSVLADIGTLADVQDGTVYSSAISKVADLSNSLFGLFDNAVFIEIYAIIGSTPPLDVDLKNFLESTHSDGNPVGDLSGDGSITVSDALDVSRIISGIASAAEITAYEARIKTPAQSVTALYDRYFNTSIVTAPLLTVAANILDIRQAATLFTSGTLPIAVFSQYSGFTTGNGNGLVPAPTASDIANNYVLRADGTWGAP
jgi:hypothetical protein